MDQVGPLVEWGGTAFHWLEALSLKNFLLNSSRPFFTFTLRPSAATLVTLTLSLAFSNHTSWSRPPIPCMILCIRQMSAWCLRSSSVSSPSSTSLWCKCNFVLFSPLEDCNNFGHDPVGGRFLHLEVIRLVPEIVQITLLLVLLYRQFVSLCPCIFNYKY